MSSETSENENVDIGPVHGSRPVGSADPPNPAFDLEASLSRLEPPRHRLIPVERVDGVRVERSEKVTVERAGIDGGGQSETVKIERTETVYDEQSDAVRIERSETVRVERIHTSQYDSLPSLLEESSSTEVAQQMLDESMEAAGPPENGQRTSIPDRPPPPQRPFPEPRQKAPVRKLDPEHREETIIEVNAHTGEGDVINPDEDGRSVPADAGSERSSERIEVPDRVYEAIEVDGNEVSPGAYRFKADSRSSQRRPAFFVRDQAVAAPNHRANGSQPENNGTPPSPPVDPPLRNGSGHLDIPPPKFRPQTPEVKPEPGHVEHTGEIDVRAISDLGVRGLAGPGVASVGENTGPIDLPDIANLASRAEPAEEPRSLPNPPPPKLTNGYKPAPPPPNLNDNYDPAPPRIVDGPNFGPTRMDAPVDFPPAPAPRESVNPDTTQPNRSRSSGSQSSRSQPAVSDSRRGAPFPAPPQFEPRQPESPRFETPRNRSSSIDPNEEIDPFDEYLDDPLGFFDPSEEIDAVDVRRPGPAALGATRQLKARQDNRPARQGPLSNGSAYDADSGSSSRVQPSGSSRRVQPAQPRRAPIQRRGNQDRYEADAYEDDYLADGRQPRPSSRPARTPRGRQERPPQRRRPANERQYDNYDDGYDDGYDDYEDPDEGGRFPGVDFLRSKAATIVVGLVGLSIMGLSAMYVFSGEDAPEGEILESQGFYWWVDSEVSSKSFIPESCADSLQSLGASKKSVPFSDLEEIPREDISCEEILSPGN